MSTRGATVKIAAALDDSEPLYHDTRCRTATVTDRCDPFLSRLKAVNKMRDDAGARHSALKKVDLVHVQFKIAVSLNIVKMHQTE